MGLDLHHGDIIVCALHGDYGKPRPAVIVQSDLFNAAHASITLCPITSHLVNAPLFRLSLQPSSQNGLKIPSQIMVDKIMSLQRDKIRQKIGIITEEQLNSLLYALKMWLNITE